MANGIPAARGRLQKAALGARQRRDTSQSIISALGFLVSKDAKDKELAAAQEENRLNRENRLEVAKIASGRRLKSLTREEVLGDLNKRADDNLLTGRERKDFINEGITAFDRTKAGKLPFLSEQEVEDAEPEGAFTKGLKALGIAGSQAVDILGSPVEAFVSASAAPGAGAPGVIESLFNPRSPQGNGDPIIPGDLSPDAANATFAAPGVPALPGIGGLAAPTDIPAVSDSRTPVSQAELNTLIKQHGRDVINAQFRVLQ